MTQRRFRLKAGSEDVLTEYPHNEEEEEQEELNRAVKTQRDQLDASMADTRIRDSVSAIVSLAYLLLIVPPPGSRVPHVPVPCHPRN